MPLFHIVLVEKAPDPVYYPGEDKWRYDKSYPDSHPTFVRSDSPVVEVLKVRIVWSREIHQH